MKTQNIFSSIRYSRVYNFGNPYIFICYNYWWNVGGKCQKGKQKNLSDENTEEEIFERGKYRSRETRKENLNELKEEN